MGRVGTKGGRLLFKGTLNAASAFCGNLGQFMRRLLTGYAVTFNLRHHRSGHLFQNRYKSIICEEVVNK